MQRRASAAQASAMTRLGIRPALATLLLLTIPFVGTQVSDQWHWEPLAFVRIGVILFGVGLLFEWLARRTPQWAYRTGLALVMLTSVLLVWMNLVGHILGDAEDEPANLVYFAEVGIGFAGALLARFRPRGLFYASLAVAGMQAAVTIVAHTVPLYGTDAPTRALTLNLVLLALFSTAALLFRKAAEDSPRA